MLYLYADIVDVVRLIKHYNALLLQLSRHHVRHLRSIATDLRIRALRIVVSTQMYMPWAEERQPVRCLHMARSATEESQPDAAQEQRCGMQGREASRGKAKQEQTFGSSMY